MQRHYFARLLMLAGALQFGLVACDDTSVVGGDAARDNAPPTDNPIVDDRTPTDERAPTADVGRDAAPDVGEDVGEDAAPDVGEDAAPDVGEDAAPDVAKDAAPDVIVEDVTPDVAPDMMMMGECRTSADCAMAMGGPVCDTATNRCVPCSATEDVCPVGNYCNMGRCAPGCRAAMDCTGGMRCDTATRMCVGCLANTDCALGTICRANSCVPGCGPDRACGAGSTCCGTACVDTNNSVTNCGACGTTCGTGESCCAGRCANSQTDARNCGACGSTCALPNTTATCVAGACAVGTCATGFANCDMMSANGCEVDTRASATSCGACGTACTGASNASATCTASVCGIACNTGFGNCDAMNGNGCEVNTGTSAANCGRCGNACPARDNAMAACAAGACGFACNTGFGNCDGNATNGCETNVGTSAVHCGSCGRACTVANGVGVCTAGACGIGACNPGFGNCDGNAANGCETATRTDRANCGACGNACSARAVCFDGTCRDLCTTPLVICGTTCINTATDNNNCGACGTICSARTNGTNTCQAGACTLVCGRGFGNCDGNAANGCEVNLTTTTTQCGACGRACSFPNATAACVNGACGIGTCNAGFANCDGNPANGCEVNLTAMTGNCGACGRICSFANAAATCATSTCVLGACATGFGDCNRSAADGCEVDTRVSSLHCGACGRACLAGQACLAGVCVAGCPVGTTFCGGACVDVRASNANCGACGRVCAAGTACLAGTCTALAPVNDTSAGALLLNLSTSSVDLTGNTAAATNNVATPCLGGTNAQGRDVFYRFVLTRREFVFADTRGSTYDTALFFLDSMGRAVTSQTAGDLVCNDDGDGACTSGSLHSRAYTVLAPGEYFLVVSGYSTNAGAYALHFEHAPAGSGAINLLALGSSVLSGVTDGAVAGTLTSATCGGAGPENAYWWITCPAAGTSAALTAETCGTAAFDTVLYLNTGSGFTACNDQGCDNQSRLSAAYALSARLHALYVDGFTSTAAGAYTLRVSRP